MLFAMSDDTLDVDGEVLKKAVIELLRELEMEMETAEENIAIQGVEHIHFDELILTISPTRIVERFLRVRKGNREGAMQVLVIGREDNALCVSI